MDKLKFRTAVNLARSLFRQPAYMLLYVTYKCDLNCPFCFNKDQRSQSKSEMKLSEFETLARSSGKFFELLISGGEPFLRNDLEQILQAFLRHCQPSVIAIPTHGGHSQAIHDILSNLLPKYPATRFHINLSIDQIGEKHDAIRGRKGLMKRIIQTSNNLKTLKQKHTNLWLGVTTIVGEHNDADVENIVKWIKTTISPDMHEIGLIRETLMHGDPHKVINIYEKYQKLTQRYYPPDKIELTLQTALHDYLMESIECGRPADGCPAGKSMVTITPEGNVYPCEPLWLDADDFPAFDDTCMGSLKDFSGRLNWLLSTEKARNILTKIQTNQCSCFWECALFANILFTSRGWVRILKAFNRKRNS